jgi:hypothetical protein
MWPENDLLIAAIKAIGAIAGAVLALVFQPPKTVSDFVTRSVFSTLAGVLFSEPVRAQLGWADTLQMALAASSLTALASWWIWGAAVRIIGRWQPPK